MTNRRDFLKLSALAVAATTGMPGFLARAAAQAGGTKTLVVIQLTGGNDGLNTLVPYSNGAYYAARPTIAVAKKDVLTLTPDLGMHPALRPLMPLWDAGKFAWIENVGYPNPNRSHFASMAIWHTADPTQAQAEGWIGRIAERIGDPFCASNIGATTPQALRAADFSLPSIDGVDRFQLKLPQGLNAPFTALLDAPRSGEAEYLVRATRQMMTNTARVQASVKKYRPGATYPESAFAAQLRDTARLIAAGVGQRVLYVSLGGFDTHAGQRAEQDELLATLAEGLAAFHADLQTQGLADDVIVMGFSEFGRRVAENDSAGTDHGKGSVMFALGQGVKGGVHGSSPDLEDLSEGDVKYKQDFRGVYAGALTRWLQLDARAILNGDFAGPAWVA
ncbi:uncharacterized protein (DUF1501 family) [Deinococcus metalli]|uniref:Uncharacterized protein (DUF1501 family) n=1 Tax=Deinococcus metalli TaxID=1141878 RepID=A0A7W8NSV5_9DEIO|nr:DUF1501 domain-containing protein [Deinococcus metalli]MBB5378378.1 uncharacterized protein (DUF1501 family) [Deinococcus metalli]GHF59344.1 hypothetical protein GCM10017781_39530 [Deinococcus metalli]